MHISYMKRLIAGLLLAALLIGMGAILPAFAEELSLRTDKTEYVEGEAILVTATGSGDDWVGLYEANPTGKASAAYWYYIARDGHASGDTVDIHNADYVNAGDCPHLMGIPAGEYRIVLCPNNGYDVAEEVLITVKKAPLPEDPSVLLSTDKAEYREGEPIRVTATGRGTDWVGLYKADDEVGSVVVGPWYYVAQDGNASGQAAVLQEVGKFDGNRTDLAGIPAGDYKVVLFSNNTYQAITEAYFTVKPIGRAEAPASATYTSANAGVGRAAGTIRVTAAEGALPFGYELWWGNADGVLVGYTPLASVICTGAVTEVELSNRNQLIPPEADRILVYASNNSEGREGLISEQATAAMLPDDVAGYSFGDCRKEFAVLGDLHLTADETHRYNQQFAAALADVRTVSPDSNGIFINGDVTDHGIDSEFAAYRAILAAAGDLPPVYAAVGEHDLFGQGSDAMRIERFLKGTGNDAQTVYFDVWLSGIHCIFLGGETLSTDDAELSKAQLTWLSELLAKDKAEGKTAFIFLHHGLKSTVAGTQTKQGIGHVADDEELRAILAEHPEAVLFSGHSHWTLQSKDTFLPATDKLPTMLNTAACSVLWDNEASRKGISLAGSQGYYVYLYEKQIVFCGRDFTTGEWLTEAMFVVDWSYDLTGNTPDGTPEDTTEETAVGEGEDTTAVGETDTAAIDDPDSTADASSSESGSEAVPTTPKSGCASTVGASAALALLTGSALLLMVKREGTRTKNKKEED